MNRSAVQTRSTTNWLRALVYLLCMTGAVLSASAFVIGGMVAGARGWPAVLLAGAVPVTGLIWALVLSSLHRGHVRHRPIVEQTPAQWPPEPEWSTDPGASRAA